MRRKLIYGGAALLTVAAVLATLGLAVRGRGEPATPNPLADRLRSLLARQEDGSHILLPPGYRNLRRTVEAAYALSLLDELDEPHLAQAAGELESSWSPELQAYRTDDGPAEYGGGRQGRELYHRDLLELNVQVAELLRRTRARPRSQALPEPSLGPLSARLADDPAPPARALRARAARLSGDRRGAPVGSCRRIAEQVRAGRLDRAGDMALDLPGDGSCATEVGPLLGEVEARERRLVSRVTRDGRYSAGDVVDLERLTALARAGGRPGVPAASVGLAKLLLRHLDDAARDFGPATETWMVVVLGRLLDGSEPPALEHLTRRLESLVDFRGSLATSASADWYSRTLMAHLMVLSGALSADEAAKRFGHPAAGGARADAPDWVHAFVGLRSRSTAGLRLPREVLAIDDEPASRLLTRALYAADAGSCPDAPDAGGFRDISAPGRAAGLRPGERLSYALSLKLSVRCSAALGDLLAELAGQVRLPRGPPDPTVRGSLHAYLPEVETVCLARGSVALDAALVARLEAYLRDVSTGTVTESFDFLDLYAALRLLSLHRGESCAGSWWEGLGHAAPPWRAR